MDPAIDAIDDEVQPVAQLIASEPLPGNAANDQPFVEPIAVNDVVAGAACDTALAESAMHDLDDVAALAEITQRVRQVWRH